MGKSETEPCVNMLEYTFFWNKKGYIQNFRYTASQ